MSVPGRFESQADIQLVGPERLLHTGICRLRNSGHRQDSTLTAFSAEGPPADIIHASLFFQGVAYVSELRIQVLYSPSHIGHFSTLSIRFQLLR